MAKPRLLLITLKDLEGPGYVGRYHHFTEQLSKYFDIYLFCARQPWKQRDRDASAWKSDEYAEELSRGYPVAMKNPYLNEIVNGPFNIRQVRSLIDKHDIDIVVNGSNIFLGFSTLLWRRGRPVAFDLGDYFPELSRDKGKFWIPDIVRKTLETGIKFVQESSMRSSDIVTANTELLAQYVRDDIGKQSTHLVSNAVNTSLFKPVESDVRSRYNIDDGFLFGFGGTLNDHFLLEAVVDGFETIQQSTDKEAKLMIVGDGPNRESVQTAVEQSAVTDDIVMTGSIDYFDLPEYYSAFDVGLNPMGPGFVTDVTRPLKVFEYLACGTAVLSTPITELQEHVFEDDQSVLSYVDFPEGFAETGIPFAEAARTEAVQQAARDQIVGHYDWDSVGEQLATEILLPALKKTGRA